MSIDAHTRMLTCMEHTHLHTTSTNLALKIINRYLKIRLYFVKWKDTIEWSQWTRYCTRYSRNYGIQHTNFTFKIKMSIRKVKKRGEGSYSKAKWLLEELIDDQVGKVPHWWATAMTRAGNRVCMVHSMHIPWTPHKRMFIYIKVIFQPRLGAPLEKAPWLSRLWAF